MSLVRLGNESGEVGNESGEVIPDNVVEVVAVDDVGLPHL